MTDPVEEAAKLPLSQKLEHSHWKVRATAYEELAKKFTEAEDSNAGFFNEFAQNLKKIILDKNAVALEKGLSTIQAFYDRYDHAAKWTGTLAASLIDKCLGGRPGTKDGATTILLQMVEVDTNSEGVVAALLEGAKNKVPKVAAASIGVLELEIKTFGVKVIPPKEILKAFPSWFDHTNPDVRAAATALVVELRRWLGKIIDKPVSELRPAQIKDLEAAFEKLPTDPAVPLKYRRSEADAMMAAAAAAAAGGPSAAPKEVDAYDVVDAVNVLSKVNAAFYEALVSKKWKERKEALDMLVAASDNPKLESGDYAELAKNLKKCLNDANVFVVELATRCLGMLGRGLRKEFSTHARQVIGALLDKLKEKKQIVVTAIQEALERMHPHCFGLTDIIEDLETAGDHKVPQVKSEMLTFVIKCLKTSNKAAMQKQVKPFCGLFMKLMDDGDATVREKSFEAFGVLIGVVSERALQGYIAKLDKIKEKRVREFIPEGPVGIAGPVAGAPAAVAPAPIDAAALADIASSINSDKPAAKKKAAAAATAAPKKAGSTIAKPSGAAAKSSPTRKSAAAREDDNDNGTSVDASGRMDISSKITPKLLQTLDDSDWKKRHEALTQVEQILIDANKKIQPKIGNLFVALKSRLTDSNKNLVQVTLNLLGDFASAIGSAVEPHMKMIVPNIFVNFTDGKQNIRDAAALCLDKWVAEVTMDPFVAYLHNAINQPSGRKELLTWMGKHFANISKKVDLKPLIKDVLLCIDDKSKEVRSLAEPLLAEIARRGNSKTIEDQISKLKPATAAPIRALLANLKATTPTKSTAAVRDRAPSTTTRLSDVSKLSPTESDGTSPAASPRSRSDSISETPPASMGPIRRNTGKAVREKSSAVPSIWFFDSVAPQLVEALENQARECFSEELLTKLFGSGVGEYFEGLTELESHIEFSQDAVIDSLDVLLKWSSIRLFESNIPLQRKVISLVSNLLGFLEIWKHTLSDYEAQSFVLVFIERMGTMSNDLMLESTRALLKQVLKVFPASKTFRLVLNGSLGGTGRKIKMTARSRAEFLRYVGSLLHQQSISVCKPAEDLPVIAEWIGDAQPEVGEAALVALLEAYRYMEPKEEIWQLLESIPEAHKRLLKKKIENPLQPAIVEAAPAPAPAPVAAASTPVEAPKTTPNPMPAVEEQPTAAVPVATASPKPPINPSKAMFYLELDKMTVKTPEEFTPKDATGAPFGLTAVPAHLLGSSGKIAPSSPASAPNAASILSRSPARMLQAWLQDINSADAVKSVEGMKDLHHLLKDDNEAIVYFSHADAIATCLSEKYQTVLSARPFTADSSRLVKYALNTLHAMVHRRQFTRVMSQPTLKAMMRGLLEKLQDESITTLPDSSGINKMLNMMMLKVLDSTDRTTGFVLLLELLREAVTPLTATPVGGKIPASRLGELIMKCLLKMNKVALSEVNVAAVLREFHNFFVAHPAASWKNREDEQYFPSIKSILQRFVHHVGFDVYKHLYLIPSWMSTNPPLILQYIRFMLVQEKDRTTSSSDIQRLCADALGGNPADGSLVDPDQLPPIQARPPPLKIRATGLPAPQFHLPKPANPQQIKEAVSILFRKILQPETSRQGLLDLYYLQRDHGQDVDLESALVLCSQPFSDLVRHTLSHFHDIDIESSSEVRDPNSPSIEVAAVIDGYQDRLRSVQHRFGLPSRIGSSPSVSSFTSAPTPAFGANLSYGSSYVPTPSYHVGPTSVVAATNSLVPISQPVVSNTSSLLGSTSSVTTGVRPVTADKSSVLALRERLRQVSVTATATAEAPPDAVASVPIVEEPDEPEITPPTITQPTTTAATKLADLRERLARIKGQQ